MQEQKYLVGSFNDVLGSLHKLGAVKTSESRSTHYYTRQPSNDVVKLVVHGGQAAIHKLEERGGNFGLVENTPVDTEEAGLQKLRQQGHHTLDVVRMAHTDYALKGGTVGLYTINDTLHSVILTYPEGGHAGIETELGLQTAERLEIPYNKNLEKLGKLETIELEG